ncbi:AAA family ATPase [Halofilum ochraceum]|uniref:bifunctional aminoglycoside phosphotransferase/ATP-binding protein n=1 Tax=Halofilum ochraceum TaxID=1611323 RepID=UPI000A727389|nr:bifunctional aminoglycoside phosphotransferase/ATP-binding protein [Halofilum ochraceum]
MSAECYPAWIRALLDPGPYPHPVDQVEVVETHISWVLLAGAHAYKFKKPVDFGFVDFTTLERRRFFCQEELRRNQPLAAEIYEAVIAVCGDPASPQLYEDGHEPGEAFEFGVRMRRFDSDARLDHRLAAGQVTRAEMGDFARRLARFHAEATRVDPASAPGTPEAVMGPARENIRQLEALLQRQPEWSPRLGAGLRAVSDWTETTGERLRPTLVRRRAEGFVRECHGDLHLGNLVWHRDRVIAFDCIEFNPAFYWIDTINELAFLVMDTADRGHPELARHVLNRYLEWSGDYTGVAVLDFYRVYRAMVRAKVAGLRGLQTRAEEAEAAATEVAGYLDLAERMLAPRPTWLALMHGLSGSGKSRVSGELIEAGDAIRLRSDVERKRLYGLSPDDSSASGMAAGIYTPEAGRRTYERLLEQAGRLLHAGWPVVVDAAFLTRDQREPFLALARGRGVPGVVLDVTAPEAVLRERVRARSQRRDDASEADEAVLEHQIDLREPVTADEADRIVTVDTTAPREPSALWARVAGQ